MNVYKEQADFSSTIGQLIPGQKYPYDVKLNGWYQVNLSDGNKSGWVKAEQVEESLWPNLTRYFLSGLRF